MFVFVQLPCVYFNVLSCLHQLWLERIKSLVHKNKRQLPTANKLLKEWDGSGAKYSQTIWRL